MSVVYARSAMLEYEEAYVLEPEEYDTLVFVSDKRTEVRAFIIITMHLSYLQ